MSAKKILKAIGQLSTPEKIMIGVKIFSSLTHIWDFEKEQKKEKLKKKIYKGLNQAHRLAANPKKDKKHKTLSDLILSFQ